MKAWIIALVLILAGATGVAAQTPDLNSLLPAGGGTAAGRIIQLVALLTVLSVAPGLLVMALAQMQGKTPGGVLPRANVQSPVQAKPASRSSDAPAIADTTQPANASLDPASAAAAMAEALLTSSAVADPKSRRDIGFAIGIVAILSIFFLPVPAFLIDLGLAFSIAMSVLVLMVALWIQRPLDFSAFPTILLVVTLLRLALNIATTRLILSHGPEGVTAAGYIIGGFSKLVMSGDFVIGLIVFAILMTVNFVVITKGATRIAEVGARFTLDAIPGKQMAIDADLNAGLIDDKEAQRRRRELEEESSFFGSMDGASKFVRGDAIAGIIILAVNIFGGIVIGTTRHNMLSADGTMRLTTK